MRLSVVILILPALICSCRQKVQTPCLQEDLGQYGFVEQEIFDGGCRARYRSPAGGLAVAEVQRGGAELFGQEGHPVPFEKHLVRARRFGQGTEVVWPADGASVKLFLEDQAVAQGPVLRAYLFRYPSLLPRELESLEEQTDRLRQQARRLPQKAALHLEAARGWLKQGKEPQALQELYAAIDADRTCEDCYREFYAIFHRQKQWDLAIRSARRLEELMPARPEPQLMLGDIYFEVQNGQQALNCYRRALELGLQGADAERAAERLKLLESGLHMIRMVKPASPLPGSGSE
jgi:hypothetical protein